MSAGKSGIFSKTELSAVQLANDQLFVSFLAEVGAKMNSLKSVRSGREFLYQPPGDPYRRAAYGASFADYDTSGFDECCPTIAECIYPEPGFAGRKMPDHGDLWSASWDYWAGDGELFFETQGKSLPYRFQKSARLEDHAIMLAYEIENTGSEEFAFLWSAHPLLAVEASCRIVLPEEVSGLFVEWSRGERLVKFGDSCGWPIAACKDGESVDLSALRDASARTADKVFTSRLQEGFCALSYPQTKETIAFHFNPQDVPYLGIWICQGPGRPRRAGISQSDWSRVPGTRTLFERRYIMEGAVTC